MSRLKLKKANDPKHNVVGYAKVPSGSNKYVFYFVVKYSSGKMSCSCGDYMFRRPRGGCKHIKQFTHK